MSPRLRTRAGEERGAVLVAGLLLALALLIAIGASVDIGRVFIARRALVALADEAALAGSQALELEARHAGRLALDPERARAGALGALAGAPGLSAEVSASESRVTVRLRRRIATALLPLVGIRTLAVAATASAVPREP